jgi:hypothetical protein
MKARRVGVTAAEAAERPAAGRLRVPVPRWQRARPGPRGRGLRRAGRVALDLADVKTGRDRVLQAGALLGDELRQVELIASEVVPLIGAT